MFWSNSLLLIQKQIFNPNWKSTRSAEYCVCKKRFEVGLSAVKVNAALNIWF